MLETKQNAIKRAQELLLTHPFDIYHTLQHHKEVVDTISEIINAEKIKVNSENLEIAAWWHDVFKDNPEEIALISAELIAIGISNSDIQTIISFIDSHSFGKLQETLEEKLLYDSDKLALVSIPRWEYAFNMYDKGAISIKERDKYIPEWNRRMPILESKLHFKWSKTEFNKRHKDFIKWLIGINRYRDEQMI